MELNGKVGIITGATSGIGRATALLLSEAGMKLVVTGRRAELLESLVEEMASEAVAIDGDISDPELPNVLVSTAQERFGQLDFVFNNAGIMNIASIEEEDDETMARMIEVNVTAATRMAYAALKVFRAQGSGDLINTSSIVGTKVRPTAGVYCGTKFAIEAFTEALRMEVAKSGVRVCALEPGYVKTELQDHWRDDQKEILKAIERPLDGSDLARAVKFVLESPPHVTIPRIMVLPADQPM